MNRSSFLAVTRLCRSDLPFEDPTGDVAHRPWPLPGRPWIQRMRWLGLLFAHWPVKQEAIRALVPPGLQIDVFEGSAWIGITPFVMSRVSLRGVPAPLEAHFLELNARTYVRIGDRPGVWFFSLDASSILAVIAARAGYHLPYFKASMSIAVEGDAVVYRSDRVDFSGVPARFAATYRAVGEPSAPARGSLEEFLIERYCLYSVDGDQRAHRTEIHHRPWSLQAAEAAIAANTYPDANGIALPEKAPLLHYSRLLDVVSYPPQTI